jgi:hypothetical protein
MSEELKYKIGVTQNASKLLKEEEDKKKEEAVNAKEKKEISDANKDAEELERDSRNPDLMSESEFAEEESLAERLSVKFHFMTSYMSTKADALVNLFKIRDSAFADERLIQKPVQTHAQLSPVEEEKLDEKGLTQYLKDKAAFESQMQAYLVQQEKLKKEANKKHKNPFE